MIKSLCKNCHRRLTAPTTKLAGLCSFCIHDTKKKTKGGKAGRCDFCGDNASKFTIIYKHDKGHVCWKDLESEEYWAEWTNEHCISNPDSPVCLK